MDEPSREDLAQHWWEHQRLAQGTHEQRKALLGGESPAVQAADDEVRRRVDEGGTEALQLMLALALGAPDERDLGLLGAGPLEDLLVEHGDELARQIDDLARREPRIRTALTGVWLSRGELQPEAEAVLARWLPRSP